jgi:NDP-sugar pyrophosphorylase family protein
MMKALILAAGRGTRIRSIHGEHPKCLIRLNGSRSTILDHQIDSLFSAEVANIGIVVGYEKDQIVQHVIENYGDEQTVSASYRIRRSPQQITFTPFGWLRHG